MERRYSILSLQGTPPSSETLGLINMSTVLQKQFDHADGHGVDKGSGHSVKQGAAVWVCTLSEQFFHKVRTPHDHGVIEQSVADDFAETPCSA